MSGVNLQHNDIDRTDPQTLQRWIIEQQRKLSPEAKGNLSILLGSISVACKFVASAVRKVEQHATPVKSAVCNQQETNIYLQAGLAGLLGLAGSANVQVRVNAPCVAVIILPCLPYFFT